MTIAEQLVRELRDAMKARDARRRDVIRQVQTEAAVAKSQPGFADDVDDDFYTAVIAAYVKKMDKSRSEYEQLGERGEAMAEKLAFEVEYLSRWLPTMLDEEATRALVAATIAELGVAGDEKAAGKVIGQLMRDHGEELDGSLVNRVVREELTGG